MPKRRPHSGRQAPRLHLPTQTLAPKFNPNRVLRPPSSRQNPFLRLLRFDTRERTFRQGLSPPDFNQSPVFRQVIRTPQRSVKNQYIEYEIYPMRSCNSPRGGPTSETFWPGEIFLNDRKSLGYSDFVPNLSNMIVPGNTEKSRSQVRIQKTMI